MPGQAPGVHDPPANQSLEAEGQAAWSETRQEPVKKLQHRPRPPQRLGLHAASVVHEAAQWRCDRRVHVPESSQHAPIGSHWLDMHELPSDQSFDAEGQSGCCVTEQEPVMKLQHRPRGRHLVGVHAVWGCQEIPPKAPMQWSCVRCVQASSESQHAPTGGHALGVHDPFGNQSLDAAGQSNWVLTKHEPVMKLQQIPVSARTGGAHARSRPRLRSARGRASKLLAVDMGNPPCMVVRIGDDGPLWNIPIADTKIFRLFQNGETSASRADECEPARFSEFPGFGASNPAIFIHHLKATNGLRSRRCEHGLTARCQAMQWSWPSL
jgi:hypothetical protein